MSQNRTELLESRVATLELQVNELRRHVYETSGVQAPRPARAVVPPPAPYHEVPAPAPEAPPELTMEAFFGGRLLLGAGALAFLLGVAFFLKYAFDNGWVGPTGRVAMGLIGGAAFMFAGDYLFRRGQHIYAAAITGLGSAILYLSLWAAGSYFHLVPLGMTFGAMIAVTAATMTIAIRRNMQPLAIVSVIGALLTPPLNAGATNLTEIFSYLVVINLVLLWLPAKRWPILEALAFVGTQLYVFAEMPWNVVTWTAATATTLIFATVYAVQFTMMPVVRAYRNLQAAPYESLMVLLAAVLYYIVLCDQLFTMHRHWLTAASIVLAAVYLLLAYFTPGSMRQMCAAAALGFITIGTGLTFTGASMPIAWSIEGAALVITGTRVHSLLTRSFGYAAYVAAFFSMMSVSLSGGALFANDRFSTLFITAITLGAVAYVLQGGLSDKVRFELHLPQAAETLAHFFALLAIGYELDVAFRGSALAISLLMLVYAALLVTVGFIAKRLFTRWEGLWLLGVLVVKVFLIDLASLDTVVRIVSFLAVGSVLLIIALLYQRAQNGKTT